MVISTVKSKTDVKTIEKRVLCATAESKAANDLHINNTLAHRTPFRATWKRCKMIISNEVKTGSKKAVIIMKCNEWYSCCKKWRSAIWIWSQSSITKMTSSITSLLYYAVVQCALVFRRKWLADDTHIADEDCSNLLWLINTFLQLLLERAAVSINTAISHTKPISLHHHRPPTVHLINTAQHSCPIFNPLTPTVAIWIITNDSLTRSVTGCFIAVPIWQQCVWKG